MTAPASFDALCALVHAAGEATLSWWNKPLKVTAKSDDSPVTGADLAAHQLIVQGLRDLTPDIPVLSEEAADVPLDERQHWDRFWLVDPLDGTKEFINASDEFTVNIALIENAQVKLGIVGVPARSQLFWGGQDLGAWQQTADQAPQPIRVRHAGQTLTVVASRRHSSPEQDALLEKLASRCAIDLVNVGSSLKFCQIASGQADLYPRFAPTSQWDTAAAQAVLEGAGGRVIGLDGQRFGYPTRESWLNPYFIALGELDQTVVALILD